MLHLRRKATQGTTGCSAPPCSLERSWSTSSWNPFSKDQKVIRNIQLGFTSLTTFYDKITVSVDETEFSMAFDTLSHRTLLWKQREWGLDKWTVTWVEN